MPMGPCVGVLRRAATIWVIQWSCEEGGLHGKVACWAAVYHWALQWGLLGRPINQACRLIVLTEPDFMASQWTWPFVL